MTKTVIITGASSGIGKALALEFAKRGYNLGLTARRMDKLKDLQTQILAMPQARQSFVELASMDVKATDTVGPVMDELIQRLGQVDIVVANAGVNQLTSVGKGQLDIELDMIQTNLLGAIATVHAAVAYFRKMGGGHVVGISSLASLTAIPKQAAYCATKAGFSMYLDSAAIELKKYKIDFTKIMPGFVKTDIVDNMDQFPFLVTAEQAAKEIVDQVEKRKSVGIVPGYPWKFIKPLMSSMPAGVWKYIKH
jgi:short-subunit dehydrogenase